ncbi:hypothetical protein ACB092_04G173900 [Castanea dentata]
MHVLPDSFVCLESDCLIDHPWEKFPFSTFVAMLSALLTLMLDSLAMSYHTKPNAQVLEVGIVVSGVIGLSLGASHNPCMIRPLTAAMKELALEMHTRDEHDNGVLFLVYNAIWHCSRLCLSNMYSENSPTALILVGVLDATPAGILNYKALVNLLVVDFMGYKLQQNVKFQMLAFLAVLLGVVGMTFHFLSLAGENFFFFTVMWMVVL